jgi:cell division protein FtsL
VTSVLSRRLRGFRVLDLVALGLVLALALTVYAFKTSAGRQRASISEVEEEIRMERRNVTVLAAEVARLESPARLERLARTYAGLAPVSARQEVTPQSLPVIAAPGAAP